MIEMSLSFIGQDVIKISPKIRFHRYIEQTVLTRHRVWVETIRCVVTYTFYFFNSAYLTVSLKDELGDNFPIKIAITGGQPITRQTISCLRQLCRYIMISYGGTEMMLTSANIITHPDTFIEHSCGPVVPGKEVKVVDLQGDIVPVNTSGEIYIKSRSIFSGYYNDQEKTAAAFTEDGWFKVQYWSLLN